MIIVTRMLTTPKKVAIGGYQTRHGKRVSGYRATRHKKDKQPKRKAKPSRSKTIFCPECGSLYIVKTDLGVPFGYCPRCNEYVSLDEVDPAISQVNIATTTQDKTIIYDDVPIGLKIGKGRKDCKHKWEYVSKQTRSGDEGMTNWSVCSKCGRVVKGYVPNTKKTGKV